VAPPSLGREVQQDFSAGMFRGVDPLLIPRSGAYDIVGLLDEDGAVSGRGGSTVRSTSDATTDIRGLWHGFAGTTELTLFWGLAGDIYKLNANDSITAAGDVSDLVEPMTPPASIGGKVYFPGINSAGSDGATYDGTTFGTYTLPTGISSAGLANWHVAVAGNRLWMAQGETLVFSDRDTPGTFGATSIHKIPGAKILRIVGFRDSLIALTTRGVWRFSNIVYNLTDASGNVQHRIDQVSQDVIPRGGLGVTTWAGGLIVPALDGVWELPLGVQGEPLAPFARISDNIAKLYRDEVENYPGQVAVFRGHLLLPTTEAGGDVLVCRLDHKRRPWSRMDDPMTAFLVRPPASGTTEPELLGVHDAGLRIVDVNYFAPEDDQSDPDAGTPVWSVTTRDFPTGGFTVNTATGVRLSYELADPAAANPTIAASYAVGEEGAAFTALSGSAAEDSSGVGSVRWSLRKRTRSIRYKFVSSGAYSRCKVRGIESFSRPSARL
jgi:hypothetical protein